MATIHAVQLKDTIPASLYKTIKQQFPWTLDKLEYGALYSYLGKKWLIRLVVPNNFGMPCDPTMVCINEIQKIFILVHSYEESYVLKAHSRGIKKNFEGIDFSTGYKYSLRLKINKSSSEIKGLLLNILKSELLNGDSFVTKPIIPLDLYVIARRERLLKDIPDYLFKN